MKAFRGFLFCILFLTFSLTRKNYFPQSIYLCSMEWLINLFVEQSALQAVIILSLITAIGLGLGKIHICGISLGVTFVFFTGILAGHLGLAIDPQMLSYAESFGLVLFVYSLGLQVGPGFFSSFQRGGYRLNLLGLGVIFLGTIMAVVLSMTTPISLPDIVGILCGATTNTPALGAAQQTLKQLGEPTSGAALSCAVTYPLGVVGVILPSSLSESSSYARLTCRSMNTTTPTTRTLLLFRYTILPSSTKAYKILLRWAIPNSSSHDSGVKVP